MKREKEAHVHNAEYQLEPLLNVAASIMAPSSGKEAELRRAGQMSHIQNLTFRKIKFPVTKINNLAAKKIKASLGNF